MIFINSNILSWLNSNYGCNISADYYKNYIDVWGDWWRGYYKPFHNFTFNNGMKLVKRDIYRLNMAKKVCEDWAAILLNSKTFAVIEDEKASDYVLGNDRISGIFGENSFWGRANRLVEKAFYSGTGAVTLFLHHAGNSDGTLTTIENTRLRMRFMSAEQIIPISTENGRITEAAFLSERTVRGRKYTQLEIHVKNDAGNYVIHNAYFYTDNGAFSEEKLPEDIAGSIDTLSPVPWFAIFTPNIENSIPSSGGLGISILHGTTDILKGIDLAYNNFVKDFELGGKKVFMQRSLVDTLSDGTPVAPDDVGQQLFQYIGNGLGGDDGKTFIYEFNPTLRVSEGRDGIQAQLDYLSFKCGLGNKHYQFNSGTVITATQYTGEKQDLIQNAQKHYITVEEFLISLIRSIIHIGNSYFSLGADENTPIEIQFDKAILIDEAAERVKDMQDVQNGLMAKWEYRMKWYGESEDKAKAMCREIEGELSDDSLMNFDSGDA